MAGRGPAPPQAAPEPRAGGGLRVADWPAEPRLNWNEEHQSSLVSSLDGASRNPALPGSFCLLAPRPSGLGCPGEIPAAGVGVLPRTVTLPLPQCLVTVTPQFPLGAPEVS